MCGLLTLFPNLISLTDRLFYFLKNHAKEFEIIFFRQAVRGHGGTLQSVASGQPAADCWLG